MQRRRRAGCQNKVVMRRNDAGRARATVNYDDAGPGPDIIGSQHHSHSAASSLQGCNLPLTLVPAPWMRNVPRCDASQATSALTSMTAILLPLRRGARWRLKCIRSRHRRLLPCYVDGDAAAPAVPQAEVRNDAAVVRPRRCSEDLAAAL